MNALRVSLVLALAAMVVPTAFAQDKMQQAPPGTVNYVEGTVRLDGQQLAMSAVGSRVMQPGEVLSTTNGRAEILLTPGVFLRIGHDSAVQMVNPDLMNTQLRLTNGKATVEVDLLYKQNHIEIAEDGITTQLDKVGFYEFDANSGLVRTYQGRAMVQAAGSRPVKLGNSRQLLLPPASATNGDTPVALHELKAQHFNRKQMENSDALVAWSKLRSHYLAQANAQLAYEYAGYPGFVPGWYWNPWGMGYTWIPGNGMFWNPFGWGFYSPIWMNYYYPYYYGGYGVAYNSGGSVGHVTAGRNFNPVRTFNAGPRRAIDAPARGFSGRSGVSSGAGFSGARGSVGGGVNLGAGGFGGGGHVSAPASGGHGH